MKKDKPQKDASAANEGFAIALVEYLEMFVLALAVLILLFTLGVRTCVVSGPSMKQTLQDSERLIISNLFYTPKQGDIVVFHQTGEFDAFNEPIVKRVIATGGQYVKIDYQNNRVYVSSDDVFEESEVLDEKNYAYFNTGIWRESQSHTEPGVWYVPEGYLFVLGDNRNESADSRYFAVGLVDERRVLGKAILRITPFSAFGRIL